MKTRFPFFALFLSLCSLGLLLNRAYANEPVQVPAKDKFHLFLLVGQSNMAGRGAVSDSDRTPHPRVLMLNKENQWVPAIDPLHFDKPKAVGTGLGKTFATIMAEADPDVTIGLIPCAVGGTPISLWEPGAFDKITQTHPWDDALTRARLALKDGTLKGILWHQGEGDANAQQAPLYYDRLVSLVSRFRKELNAPDVPFVLGQVGQFEGKPWSKETRQVDQAMHKLAEQIPHVALVSSEGLVDKGDKTHFDADSYREFGKRYAAAFQSLVQKK